MVHFAGCYWVRVFLAKKVFQKYFGTLPTPVYLGAGTFCIILGSFSIPYIVSSPQVVQ